MSDVGIPAAFIGLRGNVFVCVRRRRRNDWWRQNVAIFDRDLNLIDSYTEGPQGVVYEPVEMRLREVDPLDYVPTLELEVS